MTDNRSPALPTDRADPTPRVLSVNVGAVREVEWRGRTLRTGIWKEPVGERAVALRGVNLEGDDQADRTVHGGPDKAVYAYAMEDYRHWREMEGIAAHPALFGENLTVQGLDLRAALVGERWRVGTALLEVAQPRLPCFKLGIRLGDARFPKRFLAAERLGAYLRIVEEGEVRAGDDIHIVSRPHHGVTLGLMAESLRDPGKAAALLAAPQLPASWRG
ncbi:MAG TPA: MOSC domain-containing protein [Gemmatimonadaceae bacterium]|nr:MOSC domain-containing protein [Gemmatimonadaceae bacterium]